MVRWTRWALGLSGVAGIALAFWVYSNSPERVPVHFTLNGVPDAWGSPIELLVTLTCVIGLFTAGFLALPALFRLTLRCTPPSMMSLPHKEYWLAPERRDALHALLTLQANLFANLFGIAINGLLISMQLALMPGHAGPSLTPLFLLIGFFVFMIVGSVWAQRSFRPPAGEQAPKDKATAGSRS
jgi:hypothetical protein